MKSAFTIAALFLSSAFALPGGGSGTTTTSSCITKTTCTPDTTTKTKTYNTPSTYTTEIVTSYPYTGTTWVKETYTSTIPYADIHYSDTIIYKTVTETEVVTSWEKVCTTTPVVSTKTYPKVETDKTSYPYTETDYSYVTYATKSPSPYTGYSSKTEYKTYTTEAPCTSATVVTGSKCATTTTWTTWGW